MTINPPLMIITIFVLLFIQLGVALGFVLPPLLVPNDDNVQANMEKMFLGTGLITTFFLFLIFLSKLLPWIS